MQRYYQKSGGNDGIGFAIPVDMVRDVVTKLVTDGKSSKRISWGYDC